MSTLAVSAITDASGGSTATINGYTPTASNMVGRNKIINGAMMIDQRNAGASVTPTNGQYLVDRWKFSASQASKFSAQQNAGSVTPPAGFTKYQGLTVTSAYSVTSTDVFALSQTIEGFNISDLAWGTANASAVTLSFRVYSSLTGTFGGALCNGAQNRSYPFTFSVASANTWTTISVTIAGDTSGTWATDNTAGMYVWFNLGAGATYNGTAGSWASAFYTSATGATSVVGTSGATFYITGVQLEKGSTATPFEYRQYGTELALCQRYFEKSFDQSVAIGSGSTGTQVAFRAYSVMATMMLLSVPMKVIKRAAPTVTCYDSAGRSGKCCINDNITDPCNISISSISGSDSAIQIVLNYGSNFNGMSFAWTASAEL